jgi:hypothetical protein
MGCGCRGSGANVEPRQRQDAEKTIIHAPRRPTDPSAPDSVWTGRKPVKPAVTGR